MSMEWYYADGIISGSSKVDASGAKLFIPSKGAKEQHDFADYLTMLNPTKAKAKITITFFWEDEEPTEFKTEIPAQSHQTLPLHTLKEKIVTRNKVYGTRISSNVPIVVQPTRGEFEPGNPVTNAMASVVAHPGPLSSKETEWYYADGIVIAREDHPLVESEWISILNPNEDKEAHIVITFFLTTRKSSKYECTVQSNRVRTIKIDDLKFIPKNEFYGVRVTSDMPVVVQETRRAYQKGNPVPRSMFSVLARPLHLPE